MSIPKHVLTFLLYLFSYRKRMIKELTVAEILSNFAVAFSPQEIGILYLDGIYTWPNLMVLHRQEVSKDHYEI